MMLSACASAITMQNHSATAGAAAQKSMDAFEDGEPYILGRTYTIASKALGADRRLTVRLPAEYQDNPDAVYPVIYVIDGGPEQDFPHIAGIMQSREVNLTFSPFILVGVETVSRRTMLTAPIPINFPIMSCSAVTARKGSVSSFARMSCPGSRGAIVQAEKTPSWASLLLDCLSSRLCSRSQHCLTITSPYRRPYGGRKRNMGVKRRRICPGCQPVSGGFI